MKKVQGSATTVYVYDASGNLAAEYATQPETPLCTTCYLTADHLGSTRLMTDGTTGLPKALHDYLPFGEEIPSGVGGRSALYGTDSPRQRFTGKERDSETGLDFFQARYFSSAQGRFTIADWSAKPEPVPYAKLQNPQSLNLYAYVLDNPLLTADHDGHGIDCSGKNAQGVGCQFIAQWNMEHGLGKLTATWNGGTTMTVTYTYPDGTTVILKGTHPWRDNNPGDVTAGQGSIGRDAGGGNVMAIYPSAAAGWNAMEETLTHKYADSTLIDTVYAWAPEKAGNNPAKYAADLAAAVGVPASTKISQLTPAQLAVVERTIAHIEGYDDRKNSMMILTPSTLKAPSAAGWTN